ncbi:hypothetical protein QNO07_09335 [Streptomyces sp. 549]|uniref:hypothetical protein n=1 Tax=Streptomyces sp. 549 TaxID=3049076 RepID=UPI0024C23A31|nr:hypothetical protein [Streptomyces sp. 549]MDK1473621.1 hypothetical protein [Streptomyces sp. 549]
MSLDARIRKIAEEAVAAAGGGGGDGASTAGRAELERLVADQQAQLKDLHDHLHRALTRVEQLTGRVTALEAAATTAPPESESGPVSRRAGGRRKPTES